MVDYEVAKTDQGYVVAIGGKYYRIPDSARLMNPVDMKILFEGIKNTTPIAGTIQRTDVSAGFMHAPTEPGAPNPSYTPVLQTYQGTPGAPREGGDIGGWGSATGGPPVGAPARPPIGTVGNPDVNPRVVFPAQPAPFVPPARDPDPLVK